MTDSVARTIKELEQKHAAIDRALTALRAIDDTPPDWVTSRSLPKPATAEPVLSGRKGKKRSAAVRRRMAEAQRLRWAKAKEAI